MNNGQNTQNAVPGESLNAPASNNELLNYAPEHSNQEIGRSAIFSGENKVETSPDPAEVFGKILPTEPQVAPKPAATEEKAPSFNRANIRVDGNRIGKNAMTEMDSIMQELSQTGDLDRFYDEAREMMSANLENSYNRKLGQ